MHSKTSGSCNAFSTAIFRDIASAGGRKQIDAHLQTVLCFSDALIQPVVEEVFAGGETSLVALAGQYSHAVRKIVEERCLGVAIRRNPHDPSSEEFQIFTDVLGALRNVPAYARVDLVRSGSKLFLLELELIEPSLHFGLAPGSADRFATYLIEEATREPVQRR